MFYRGRNLTELIALLTIMIWPVIPLFWIPVHCFAGFFKKIGVMTYVMPFLIWPPVAYLIYLNRTFLLYYRLDMHNLVRIAGLIMLTAGTALQIWTGRLLTLWGLMGVPEVSAKSTGGLATDGAFSFVRHPTYLAHTLMLGGIFLFTGVVAIGIITLLDFAVINAIVIPLEERELLVRFGDEYVRYKKRVPRYFPRLKKRQNNNHISWR